MKKLQKNLRNEYFKNKALLLIPLLVLIDQIAKYLVTDRIIVIFKQPLIFYSKNTGAAFGILKDNNFLLIFISIIILGILGYFYYKEKKLRLGLIFLFSGAIGNLIDRIFRGFVVDFIKLGSYPTFNFSDVFNLIGLIIIIYVITKK